MSTKIEEINNKEIKITIRFLKICFYGVLSVISALGFIYVINRI